MMAHDKRALMEPFFSRIAARDALSEAEKQALVAAAVDQRSYAAGNTIAREGDVPLTSMLLVSGLAARVGYVQNGGRQITTFHIAGDFLDLNAFILKRLDHGVLALSACDVLVLPHSALLEITETHPHLSRLLWLSTLLDGAIHRQWLLVHGRMDAREHMAHLFCEMFERSRAAGIATASSFPFPLTQSDLADAMGMSSVHVNRTLQALRAEGLLSWDGMTAEIGDVARLMRFAQFDPAFLHLDQRQR
jgi:CRP-like cAMP-binding protein